MNLDRNWHLYIGDMIRFTERAISFSQGLTQSDFQNDPMRVDATLRNLELIGEAATKVPDAVRIQHADLPWRQLIATLNRLIHGYLGVDQDVVWSILQTELPSLLCKLQQIRIDD